MPNGKPAGDRCINLNDENLCSLHRKGEYPSVCGNFMPSMEMCGERNEHAMEYLKNLEAMTK